MATQKWNKKEILIKYNLSTLQEIQEQTKVYCKSDLDRLFTDLLEFFQRNRKRYVYIIKLVPQELRPKLKNYLLFDEEDLLSFKETVTCDYSYKEIWCCSNVLNQTNAYGRLYLGDGIYADYRHTMEIVLGNTARLIEKVSGDDQIPYIYAERAGWGRHYNIKNRFWNRQTPEELRKLLSFAARTIEDRKKMIEEFSESLFGIEIHSLCLEFIIQNNTLTFIDWDTENDREVLNRLL